MWLGNFPISLCTPGIVMPLSILVYENNLTSLFFGGLAEMVGGFVVWVVKL